MSQKQSRVFKIKEQLQNIYRGAKGFVLLRYQKKTRLMNKKLKERIMLAITEVNGCAMCSFVHTKVALSSGMTTEEIREILGGDSSSIPTEEAVAVLFGQDFAYSKENPGEESISRLVEEYGYDKAELIVAACHMITMTNGMGIGMDNLFNRIRFRRDKNSNIFSEIFNPLLTMLLFPLFTIFFGFRCLFRVKPRTINTLYSN